MICVAGSSPPKGKQQNRLLLGCAVVLLLVSACSSGGGTPLSTSSSSASTIPFDTIPSPPTPPGGKDCGTADDFSGWPTTMVVFADSFTCIANALAAGAPAAMVVVSP